MAKAVNKKNIRKSKKIVSPFSVYWKRKNFLLLFLGVAIIIIGFAFMSMGPWNSTPSLFIAPILLVIGYLLILPSSILYYKKEQAVNQEENHIASGKS